MKKLTLALTILAEFQIPPN